MKTIIFILIVFHFSLSQQAQDIMVGSIPAELNNSLNYSKLLYIGQHENNLRAISLHNVEVDSKKSFGGFSVNDLKYFNMSFVLVTDYNDDLSIINSQIHPLSNRNLDAGEYDLIGTSREHISNSSDILTYNQLIDLYPVLANINYLDSDNQKLSEKRYYSELKYNFGTRITGFKSSEYRLNKIAVTNKTEPKKKGLFKKLGAAIKKKLNPTFEYENTSQLELDWKDTYNGSPNKKDHWKNRYSTYCNVTGNVMAVNKHSLKSDKLNIDKEFEFVTFDKKGHVLSRNIAKMEFPMKFIANSNHYVSMEKGFQLSYTVTIGIDIPKKKNNPNFDRERIYSFYKESDNDQLHEISISLPFRYNTIDTIITYDNGNAAISLSSNVGVSDNNCLIILNKDEHKILHFNSERDTEYEGDYALGDVLIDGDRYFVYYKRKASKRKTSGGILLTYSNDTLISTIDLRRDINSKVSFETIQLSKIDSSILLFEKIKTKGRKGDMVNLRTSLIENSSVSPIESISNFNPLNDVLTLNKKETVLTYDGRAYLFARHLTKKGWISNLISFTL